MQFLNPGSSSYEVPTIKERGFYEPTNKVYDYEKSIFSNLSHKEGLLLLSSS